MSGDVIKSSYALVNGYASSIAHKQQVIENQGAPSNLSFSNLTACSEAYDLTMKSYNVANTYNNALTTDIKYIKDIAEGFAIADAASSVATSLTKEPLR